MYTDFREIHAELYELLNLMHKLEHNEETILTLEHPRFQKAKQFAAELGFIQGVLVSSSSGNEVSFVKDNRLVLTKYGKDFIELYNDHSLYSL